MGNVEDPWGNDNIRQEINISRESPRVDVVVPLVKDEDPSVDKIPRRDKGRENPPTPARRAGENAGREAGAPQEPLPEREALRCRLRYLSDGMVLGSREFVNQAFRLSRGHFSSNRRDGARRLRGVDSPLHAMRDLQIRAIG